MSNRPPAAQVARLNTRLTHVFISGSGPDDLSVFVDGTPVPTGQIESLSIEIIAPSDELPDGRITGILSRYETGADGTKRQSALALFPGIVELVVRGSRLEVVCPQANSFEGLNLNMGLHPDGSIDEASGVRSLQVVFASEVGTSVKIAWLEGVEESLF